MGQVRSRCSAAALVCTGTDAARLCRRHLEAGHALAETGFSFTRPSRLEIHLANTLAGPAERQRSLFQNAKTLSCPPRGGPNLACRTRLP
jgi:hypothetical protein